MNGMRVLEVLMKGKEVIERTVKPMVDFSQKILMPIAPVVVPVLLVLSIITTILSLIGGNILVGITGPTFLALLVLKLFEIGQISWFAFTSISVFVTPVYMFVGGVLIFFVNLFIVGLLAALKLGKKK